MAIDWSDRHTGKTEPPRDLREAMAEFGLWDSVYQLRRLGEFMRYNEYWFHWIQQNFDQELAAFEATQAATIRREVRNVLGVPY